MVTPTTGAVVLIPFPFTGRFMNWRNCDGMACGSYGHSVFPWYRHSYTRCYKKRQQTVTINRRVRCRQIWEQMFFSPLNSKRLKEI